MQTIDILLVILIILTSIFVVVSTFLVIKLIKTVKRVNNLLDDINYKVEKLDGVFEIVDKTTDVISSVNDKIVNLIIGGITNLFKKKNKKRKEEDYE